MADFLWLKIARASSAHRTPVTWDDKISEITDGLRDQYSVAAIDCTIHRDAAATIVAGRMRAEFVGWRGFPSPWLALHVNRREQLRLLETVDPWDVATFAPWTSLSESIPPTATDFVVVWRDFDFAHQAAAMVADIAQKVLGVTDPTLLSIERERSTAVSANPAAGGAARGGGGAPAGPALRRCRRCKRPLHDAESARLGLGPTCAQREGVSGHWKWQGHASAKPEHEWLPNLVRRWSLAAQR